MSTPNLARAVELWKTLCGYNKEKRTYGTWGLEQTFQALDEAVELDPTEITAFLLLRHFVTDHLQHQSFSLLTLIDEPAKVTATLETPKQILAMLRDASLIQARDRFANGLRQAISRYDAGDRQDIQDLLKEDDNLAILRRDALRSIKNLRVDQFLVGEPEAADVKPVYNKVVHQWWNVNSLLAGAANMPSGVSLNLIRDPNIFQSYFCFAIRNGANLFVVSDVPNNSHPLQAYMSRRPDRDLDRRAAKNWFPYDLLNLDYDEESRRLYEVASNETALVAYQHQVLPLKDIRELDAPDIVWLAMMFELLVERFWRQGYQAPQLSYTAEMLKTDTALLGVAAHANLPVKQYAPIGLIPLAVTDVYHEQIVESQVGAKHDNPNAWLEERYRDQVKGEALNLIALPHVEFSLDSKTGVVAPVDAKADAKMSVWDLKKIKAARTEVHRVNATSFGTREQLDADRIFIARHNFAAEIDSLARAEFETRKEAVKQWYLAAVAKNTPALSQWAAHEEIWADTPELKGDFSYHGAHSGLARRGSPGSNKFKHSAHSFLYRREIARQDSYARLARASANFLGTWKRGTTPTCLVTGAQSTYEVVVCPANAAELAAVAGCTVADLPDVLQHWTLAEPYRGNSILSRIDPMAWRVRNPWVDLDFRLVFGLSKKGLAQMLKNPGVPEIPHVRKDLLGLTA